MTIASLIPIGVLVSHVILAVLVASLVARRSWGEPVLHFVRRYAIALSFIVSLLAVAGSLVYSNVVGYPPCVLCWWQRVFLFPLVVMYLVALRKKRLSVFTYALPLTVLGGAVALYHSFSNAFGTSLLPCTAVGGECSKVFVNEFGYITIPVMALTVFVYLFIIALISRTHEDSHAR